MCFLNLSLFFSNRFFCCSFTVYLWHPGSRLTSAHCRNNNLDKSLSPALPFTIRIGYIFTNLSWEPSVSEPNINIHWTYFLCPFSLSHCRSGQKWDWNGGMKESGARVCICWLLVIQRDPNTLLLSNPTKFNYVSSYQLSFKFYFAEGTREDKENKSNGN